MNTNRVDITNLTHEQFLEHRKSGLGGSDAASILGLSEYTSRYELWCIKSGQVEADASDNIYTFFGRFFENSVVELYKYWDGTEEGFMNNYKAGNVLNEVEDKIYHYKDAEFEFLQCSPDRIITKHNKYKGVGVLEVKTIAGFTAEKYEAGLPPAYIAQAQHNLMVTGLDWLDFAILKDGRNFTVIHVQRNEEYIANLRRREVDFWYRVLKTQQAMINSQPYEEFEPEIDGTQSFEKFLKKRYRGLEETIQGNIEDIKLASEYDLLSKQSKEVEEKQQEIKNKLMFKMKDATVMTLEEGINITWRPRKDGVRVFKLNYK